jgi:hypothetical protein
MDRRGCPVKLSKGCGDVHRAGRFRSELGDDLPDGRALNDGVALEVERCIDGGYTTVAGPEGVFTGVSQGDGAGFA